MSENKARELLWPDDTRILLRFVFLNVGQGSSTIVLVRHGTTYKTILVDINLDSENEGIDVPALMTDILDGDDLEVFVNTHPHSDHLKGISELSKRVKINRVWHSGHKPGKKHEDAYKDLCNLIQEVTKNGGEEVKLISSRDQAPLFDAAYYVLSPAKYVCDDIAEEDAEARSRRIHEQCVVLRLGTGETWVLLPGDADRDAFEKRITEYHKSRLPSVALAASHHGSRSFFKVDEDDDDPYREGLNAIAPTYVVISAPRQEESKHNHPHDDALKLYGEKVRKEDIFHTGADRNSYVFDVYADGTCGKVISDDRALTDAYPLTDNPDDKGQGNRFTERKAPTRIRSGRYAQ